MDVNRRQLVGATTALVTMGPGAFAASSTRMVGSTAELGFAEIPAGALDEQVLYALPGKLPLIKKTFRPPNFETPVQYFRGAITPNKAFFVRWHLAAIPEVAAAGWTLSVGGDSTNQEAKYTLAQLKKEFKPAEVVAVCQCSGN